jgi:hypothetical protein
MWWRAEMQSRSRQEISSFSLRPITLAASASIAVAIHFSLTFLPRPATKSAEAPKANE